MNPRLTHALAFAPLALLGTLAHAQVFTLPATIDRYWYPFASTPGLEPNVPIFAALDQAGFDDRDAQFVLAIPTSGVVDPRADFSKIAIDSLTVRVVLSNPVTPERFIYDNTPDSFASSLPATDPRFVPDADAGTPLELFFAGYRNGVTASTLTETTPFTIGSPFPPREGIRSVFAATLVGEAGEKADVSNHVTQGVEAPALAIGQIAGATPGTIAPENAAVTFTPDLRDRAVRRELQRQIATGRVVFVISSLHPAAGGPGGGSGEATYPVFFTKENPLASVLGAAPRMEIEVRVLPTIDFNNDGLFPSDEDVIAFFGAFAGANCPDCGSIDINGDGIFPSDEDVISFLDLLAGGCC